jgi:predicted HTH domain antitoxin
VYRNFVAETVVTSVRLATDDIQALEALAGRLHVDRSALIKRALDAGVRELLLDEAVLAYQKGRASAWKAARSARVPLAEFIDELKRRGVPFRTDEDLLKEQVEELLRARGRR